MFLNCVKVTTHSARLRNNLHILQLKHPVVMPVIKADAYGHGLLSVARVLMEENIQYLAAGTVGEALLLRQEGYRSFILALLGIIFKEDAAIAVKNKIVPVIHDLDSLYAIIAQSGFSSSKEPVDIAIKVDTGMSRLGFSYEELPLLIDTLRREQNIKPVLLVSHLASSDCPELNAFTLEQISGFKNISQSIQSVFPDIKTSLTNSPGLLIRPESIDDIIRPGLALYGGNPFYGKNIVGFDDGLLPVMEVDAPVLAVKRLAKGTPVSYGCTFIAPRDMYVAIVAAGYANGYPRILSNKGYVLINNNRFRIVGNVCMQMFMVDVTGYHHTIKKGDIAYLLGGDGERAIKAEEVAEWWGTSSYEVFCSFGGQNRDYESKRYAC